MSYLPDLNRIEGALAILRENEPPEGYHLAFSGGKDSCVIKELARMAGVRFTARYGNTTIDPPELTGFIRRYHPDVQWSRPAKAMLRAVAEATQGPPTRKARWCCEDYKESGGRGHVNIIGVRAAESARRRGAWAPVTPGRFGDTCILPIYDWSDADVWTFIKGRGLPYCRLYDEGHKRLGCVGCPLSSRRAADFERWPAFRRGWHDAIVENWTRWHGKPTIKGFPRFQSKFRDGEDFWRWWMNEREPDLLRGDCLTGLLWTNEVGATADEMDAIDNAQLAPLLAGAKEER